VRGHSRAAETVRVRRHGCTGLIAWLHLSHPAARRDGGHLAANGHIACLRPVAESPVPPALPQAFTDCLGRHRGIGALAIRPRVHLAAKTLFVELVRQLPSAVPWPMALS